MPIIERDILALGHWGSLVEAISTFASEMDIFAKFGILKGKIFVSSA